MFKPGIAAGTNETDIMQESIFSPEFWLDKWEKSKEEDAFNVHQGFSTPEYWDRAAVSYDRNTDELSSRGIRKTLDLFKRNMTIGPGTKILEIACGTGHLSIELAKLGAEITAIDFSRGMIHRFRENIPADLEDRLTLHHMDWNTADLKTLNWEKAFDLVIAFMAPAVSSPQTLQKMISASKKACAIKGWAAKRNHPILDNLWKKIMGKPLEDKPQSLMIKVNYLWSMGYLPELTFDTIHWEKEVTLEEELIKQTAFFKAVSNRPEPELKQLIRNYLESQISGPNFIREQTGITGMVFWRLDR